MPERHPNPLRRLAQAVKWSKLGCYSTDKIVDPKLLVSASTPEDSPSRAPSELHLLHLRSTNSRCSILQIILFKPLNYPSKQAPLYLAVLELSRKNA